MNVELTGKRDLTYSTWRRTVGKGCYATNIDWVEFRKRNGKLVPVAIIEDKYRKGNLKDWQRKIMITIASMPKVPVYLVKHNCEDHPKDSSEWVFYIRNLITGESDLMSEIEYRKWIENL